MRADLNGSRNIRVICREGDPTSAVAQRRVNAKDAGRVIILAQNPSSSTETSSDRTHWPEAMKRSGSNLFSDLALSRFGPTFLARQSPTGVQCAGHH